MKKASLKIKAFPYFGSKFGLLPWILENMETEHYHFVDVFGGSAVVLLNKPAAKVETFNDLDGEIVNFFKILRDMGATLSKNLELTPYSKEEFAKALERNPENDLERARQFFIRVGQSFNNVSHSTNVSSWRKHVRKSSSSPNNMVKSWLSSVNGLGPVVERLQHCQIENSPFAEIIKKYDSKETLFYCDPPYLPTSRVAKKSYREEMTLQDHQELADLLNNVQGNVLLSGYASDFMEKNYSETNWEKIEKKVIARSSPSQMTGKKPERVECLWKNFI